MFSRTRILRVAGVTAGVLALSSMVLVACSDDDDDGGDSTVNDVAEQMVEDWNNEDAEAFAAHFTDEGLASFASGAGAPPDMTADDVRAALPDIMADSPTELEEVKDAESTDDTASGTLVLKSGATLSADVVDLVKQDDAWLVNSYQTGAGELDTEDYTSVPVALKEFEFVFNQDDFDPGTKHVFEVTNEGEQPHELVLVKLDEDVNLEEALASESEEEPEGVEFQAFAQAEPGQSTRIVFAEDMEPGRYAMICFFPDTDDPEQTPHAFKGMLSDFTIE
jgi:hypothetical protein